MPKIQVPDLNLALVLFLCEKLSALLHRWRYHKKTTANYCGSLSPSHTHMFPPTPPHRAAPRCQRVSLNATFVLFVVFEHAFIVQPIIIHTLHHKLKLHVSILTFLPFFHVRGWGGTTTTYLLNHHAIMMPSYEQLLCILFIDPMRWVSHHVHVGI